MISKRKEVKKYSTKKSFLSDFCNFLSRHQSTTTGNKMRLNKRLKREQK